MASLYFEIPSGASSCAGLIMENELSIMPIFQIVKFVFAMAPGIVYDVLMIQFLQKPKNVIGPGQAKLVPWKSSYDTSNDNNIIVPASATIVTLVSVIGKIHFLDILHKHCLQLACFLLIIRCLNSQEQAFGLSCSEFRISSE